MDSAKQKLARAGFKKHFGQALDAWRLASLSVMTRQRRRADARKALMSINEFPKNREPRSVRRKQSLSSAFVKLFVKPISAS